MSAALSCILEVVAIACLGGGSTCLAIYTLTNCEDLNLTDEQCSWFHIAMLAVALFFYLASVACIVGSAFILCCRQRPRPRVQPPNENGRLTASPPTAGPGNPMRSACPQQQQQQPPNVNDPPKEIYTPSPSLGHGAQGSMPEDAPPPYADHTAHHLMKP
ncbi:uncharacterized protein LOC135199958 [Macrobrachium nipponense]|uniref:uncharacterized protein LOC135199958 n=1 Tax=Macrobrachium nipponense TaxID=159736 RepID=UPI0030C89FD0